jgi:indolepyruvate ferredoxin oxidoreductase
MIERLLPQLLPASHAAICDVAEAAAGIKGFGHVKARNLAATRAKLAELEAAVATSAAAAASPRAA